jgi:hypothetical protein
MTLMLAAAAMGLHAPTASAQRKALGEAQGPQRPVPEVRDRASQIINPHLGPRWPNGQLRDGASQIINPPVQQPQQTYSPIGQSGFAQPAQALGASREERREAPDQDSRRWQDRRDDGIYRRR